MNTLRLKPILLLIPAAFAMTDMCPLKQNDVLFRVCVFANPRKVGNIGVIARSYFDSGLFFSDCKDLITSVHIYMLSPAWTISRWRK
jgi:hypothetical protein